MGTNVLARANYISITNLPPQLVLNPTNLVFGQLIVGQASTQTFQVINLGGISLTGNVSTTPPFAIASGNPFNIAPGQTGAVAVSYIPASAGTFSNLAIFLSNGGNSTNSLTGSAITPGLLSVLPSSIGFGTVAVGASVQSSFTLTNAGGAPLTNGTASMNGGPFSVVSGTPFDLPGFGVTNVVVSFTPTAATTYSNIIIFTANSSSRTNPITGVGAIIPAANFVGNPGNGVRPLTVTFTDSSTGTITNRFWDFGDGFTTNTTATSFTHVYANAGTSSVNLTVTGPVGTNTLTRANYILATNPPPLLAVSPGALNFGQVTIGQTNTQNFQVVNSGGLPLIGTVSAIAPFAVQNGSYNLAAGQTGLVAISFSPASAGTFSNAVVFNSNGGNSTNTVTGVGLTPGQLGITPSGIDFGAVAVGSNIQASFQLTNQGGTTLSNGTASISAGPFSILSGSPYTLPGFSSTNLVIRFTPLSAGNFTNLVTFSVPNANNITNPVTGTGALVPVANFAGTPTNGSWPLTVVFNDNSTGTITNRSWNFGDGSTTNTTATNFTHIYTGARTNTVSLTVTGPVGSNFLSRASYIVVTNLPPQLVLSPTNLSFGSIMVGQSSTQSFQLSNAGQLTLAGNVSVPPPFAIQSGGTYNLAAGQTGLVTVSFSPSAVGNFSNAVVFLSNGGNRTNAVIGNGFTPAQLAVLPSTISFGTVPVGSNILANFTLTNSGSIPLTNGVISLDAGPFSIVSPTAFVLSGFGRSNIVASFTPIAEGAFTNFVTFTSDGGNSSNQLTGVGAVIPLASFVGTPKIGSRPLTVIFADNSTGTITNRFWDFGDGSTSNSSVTTLSHTYTSAGTNDVTLTVTGPVGSNTSFRASYIISTNPPPKLIVSSTNLDFGAVVVGQTKTQNIEVVNIGGTTLDGIVIADEPFGIQSGTPYTVEVGQTGVVAVTFSPTSAGTFSNTLAFFSTGGNLTSLATGIGAFEPSSDFTAAPREGSPPLTVVFTDNSSGTITNRIWDFGDGFTTNTTAAQVTHLYAGAGTNTVSLTVTGPVGSNFLSRSDYIVITNLPPQLVLNPTNFNFGTVFLGETNIAAFQISNAGQLLLTGSVSAEPPFWIQGETNFNVSPGQTGIVAVAFMPRNAAAFSNAVVFISNGGNSTNTLTGVGVTPPQMGVSPGTLDFGALDVDVGQTAVASFVITNRGIGTITNIVASIDGAPGPFLVISTLPFDLPGLSSTNLFLMFNPPVTGTFSNVVVVSSDSGTNINSLIGVGAAEPIANFTGSPTTGLKPQTVSFVDISSGTISNRFWDFGDGATTNTVATNITHVYASAGTNTVSLTVSGPVGTQTLSKSNYIQVTNLPPQIVVGPGSLNFGTIVAATTNIQSFQVTNGGGLTLTGSVATAEPFAILGGSPFTLAPGEGGAVLVRFGPASSGNFSNVVTFVSNGGNSTNSVIGNALPPPQLEVAPQSLDLGTVALGGTAQSSFVATNVGGGLITNIVVSVSNGPFNVQSSPTFALPAFSFTNVIIRFIPSITGAVTNSITFLASNGTNRTNTVGGIGAQIPAASFTGTPTIGVRPLTVTFTDNSTGTITNRLWNFGDGSISNTTATSISHLYATASTNTVSLLVSGPVGTDSLSRSGYINVTNLPPLLALNPTNLNFGTLIVGQSATQTVQVANLGGLTLSGSAAAVSPYSILNGTPYSIAPGQTGQVSVIFSPLNQGSFSNSLVFQSNGGNSTNTVIGIALTPGQLSVLPGTLDFGIVDVNAGTNSVAALVVTNSGGAPITNATALVAGGPFSVVSGSPFTIPGFGSTNLFLAFSPGAAGSFSNVVVVSSSGGNSTNSLVGIGGIEPEASFVGVPVVGVNPLTVTFTDTSIGSVTNRTWFFGDGTLTNTSSISVTHVYVEAGSYAVSLNVNGPIANSSVLVFDYILVTNPPPNLLVGPTNLDFGQVVVGQTNLLSFQIVNGGGVTLNGTAGAQPPFAIQAGDVYNIAPGQTGLVSVAFSPTNAGNFTNIVTFVSNGGNSQPSVTGIGLPPPPQLVLNPTTLNFGSVIIGQSRTQNVQVINRGGLDLAGNVVANPPFAIQSSSSFNVLPGQTGLVSVSFSPGAPTTFNDTLVFLSNGGNSSNSVSGSGVTPPQLAVSPSSIDFGTVAVSSNLQRTFVLTNLGGATLSNGIASISAGAFTIVAGTPFALPGFGSTNLVVRFAPSSAVNFSNVVVISSGNDGGSTNVLTGVGAAVPAANFVGSPVRGLKPLTVTFTDSSTGTITNRFWTFGDGSTTNTSATSFTHVFTNASTNTVSLRVTGPVGTNTLNRSNYIAVTNLPPQLVVTPPSFAFAPTIIGQTNSVTFEITNSGGVTLTGSATVPLPFSVQNGTPYTLAPGQSGLITIAFSPSNAGNFSNAVVFLSNGGNLTNNVTGSGLTPAKLVAGPSIINFGTVAVGDSFQANLVLTNQGGAAITGGSATVSGSSFAIVSGTPFSLPGFGTTNLVLRFSPANEGAFNETVLITTANDGASTNALTGIGAVVPIASFVGNPTRGLKPLNVTFSDVSSGTITNRFWDFGDGSTTNTTVTSFSHLYVNASTGTVSLTVMGPVGSNTLTRNDYIGVTNLPAGLVLIPTNLNFGLLIVGQASTQTVQVVNNGGSQLNGTVSVLPPFSIQSDTSFNIAPGQTGQVAVSFSPTSAEAYSNVVVFLSNGGNTFASVTGGGLTPPQLSVSPATINFGTVAVGTSTQASFVLTNLGQAPLTNGIASISGTGFAILSGSPFNLPALSSTNLVVRFAPVAVGNFSNAVVISSGNDGTSTNSVLGIGAAEPIASFTGNPTSGVKPLAVMFTDTSSGTITNRFWNFGDGSSSNTTASSVSHLYQDAGTFTVSLSAIGPVGSNVLIRAGYIAVANPPPQLVLNPTNVDFGSLPIGQSSTQNVFVVNNGGLTLTGSVSAVLPFAVQNGTPYTLAPGQTGTVSISFSPVSGAVLSNAAVFLSNGGNRSLPLTGVGLRPAQMSVSPPVLDFGTVSAGASVQANFIVTNSGDLPVAGGTASVLGGPFSIVSGSPFSIPGLSSTNVRVRFNPIKAGASSNVVVFATQNAGDSTNAVMGNSTFAPVANFSATPTNGPKTLEVTFTDRSTGSITNWVWDFGDGTTSNTVSGGVSHAYNAAGIYTVSLSVTGPLGSNLRTSSNLVVVTEGLLITSLRPNGSDMEVKFNSIAGQFYRVEYTDSLSPPDWKAALQFIPGTGNIITANHAGGAGRPSRFYRVVTLTNNDLLPAANFTGSPIFGLTPLTVTFVDLSSGYVTNRFWDFGDGSSTNTTATSVSHTYTSAGTRAVTLTVSGPTGDSALTRPTYITAIDQLLITSIQAAGADILIRFTSKPGEFYRVEYTDSLLPALWRTAIGVVPGTGNILTAAHIGGVGNPSRFYRIARLGASDLVPAADFVSNPNFGQIPLKVTFTDTSTGYITNRFWDFGDGSTTNTTGTVVTHTYVSPGTNTVTLTVSGPVGNSSRTRENYISTIDYLLITSIRPSGSNVLISFTSQLGQFYRVEYADKLNPPVWRTAVDFVFGTGDIVTGLHLGGLSQSARFYRIHLLSALEVTPSANFGASPTVGAAPLEVKFEDTSEGFVTNRFWNFGDGSTTNTMLSTMSHTYNSPGTNTVTLTVTGPLGGSTLVRTNFIVVSRLLLVTGINVFGADVVIKFTSEPDRLYRVEYTDNLTLPWGTAIDNVPGNGGVVSVIHSGGGNAGARFYRIRQL